MKIPDLIQRELDTLTVPYYFTEGSRHYKLFVNGLFCGFIGKGSNKCGTRALLNVRSQIRRALR